MAGGVRCPPVGDDEGDEPATRANGPPSSEPKTVAAPSAPSGVSPRRPTRARHPPTLPPRSALSNWRSENPPGQARSKAPRVPGRQAFDEWARALGPLPARPALPFPI